MDTIGDFLTIIRNASTAGNLSCAAQWSKIREGIAKILKEEGYINRYEVTENDRGFKVLNLRLKYVDEIPAIATIRRMSKPGCKLYCQYEKIPSVLNGMGISILTTSKGIVKDKDARREKVGGELLCQVS